LNKPLQQDSKGISIYMVLPQKQQFLLQKKPGFSLINNEKFAFFGKKF
jgi:hypothetical protein